MKNNRKLELIKSNINDLDKMINYYYNNKLLNGIWNSLLLERKEKLQKLAIYIKKQERKEKLQKLAIYIKKQERKEKLININANNKFCREESI